MQKRAASSTDLKENHINFVTNIKVEDNDRHNSLVSGPIRQNAETTQTHSLLPVNNNYSNSLSSILSTQQNLDITKNQLTDCDWLLKYVRESSLRSISDSFTT